MRRTFAAVALASVFVAAPIFADEGERRLRTLLLAPEGLPDRATFERAVPEAKAILIRFAVDAATQPFLRDRALVALGAFAGADVERLYRDVLASPQTSELRRHKVLLAYARAFPVSSVPALSGALEDPRPAIRLTAIEGLSSVPDPSARRALEAALARPQTVAVERALRRALHGPSRFPGE